MAPLELAFEIRERVTTRRERTPSGKSHSCEIPTKSSTAPRAQTISVAAGSNETTRRLMGWRELNRSA